MRPLIIPFVIWLGVLQLPPANQQPISLAATGTLIAAAAGLAGLSVSIYRLGVWRQEMHNTKDNISADIARYREEMTQQFEQIFRRFTSIDSRLDQVDARLTRLEEERAT